MSKKFTYTSVLAPYMKSLLDLKISAGVCELNYKYVLKEIDDFANTENLTNPHITSEFISKWRRTRTNDSEATIYCKYSIWRQLTKTMCRYGCVCYIPRLPKEIKSNFAPFIFTQEQISAIFKATDDYRLFNKHLGTVTFAMPALLRLLYSTGVRVSEALSIKNVDVHLHEGFIQIRKTKNKSERIVPLCESMQKVLKMYIDYRDTMPIKGVNNENNLLFIKANGTGIKKGAVYCHFRKLLDKCNIPYIGNKHGPRVHDLRHTYSVHSLVQMGHNGMDLYASLPIMSTSLGHKSLSATEKYVRLTYTMYPEIENQCSEVNSFIYPKTKMSYDYNN